MTAEARARALVGLGWTVAVTFVLFAGVARFPVLYRDDWAWLEWLLEAPPSIDRLFVPHNEHLIPLARALYWLQFLVEGAHGRLIFSVALAAEAGIVVLFWLEAQRRWAADRVFRRTAEGALLVVLCFAWQLQSVVFAAAILFPLVQFFAVLAVFATAAAMTTTRGTALRWHAAGVVASLAAMLTTTNGIAVPATVALLALVHRRTRAVGIVHAVLALAGVGAFVRFVLAAKPAALSSVATSIDTWPTVAAYFFAFFAPFLTFGSGLAGAAAGVVLVSMGLLVMASITRSGDAAPRLERFASGVMLFVLVSAALAAAGRAGEYGVGQASQSRYATLTVTYWAALIVATMSLVDRGSGFGILRRLGRLAAVTAVPLSVLLLGLHLLTGVVWMAKTGNLRAGGLAMAAGVRDDQWIRTLHPSPAVVYDAVARVRARGDSTLINPDVGRNAGELTLPTCGASLSVSAAPEGPALRITGTVQAGVRLGWILDTQGTVVGLAAPAPLVDTPAPTPADVVAVVRRAFTTRTWPATGRWLGFAPASAPGPLRFVGLSGRTPVCASPVPAPSSL